MNLSVMQRGGWHQPEIEKRHEIMYDLIIKNCRIIDGTGAPWYRGDVAVKNGRIEAIGSLVNEMAAEIVDAGDHYLTPGFIDIHSHSDLSILDYSLAESRILQGITTEIGGNCGMSAAPVSDEHREDLLDYLRECWQEEPFAWHRVSEYLDAVEQRGTSVNIGTEVGHGTIRLAVMGFREGKPSDSELEEMKRYLREALEDGAFGMSSGLIYPPGSFSDIDEMSALAEELKPYHAFYATHMRNEGIRIIPAVEEAIEVCRRAQIPLEISHHKVARKEAWHTACRETTRMIREAREEGLDVTVDQYPYSASASGLDSNIPQWGFYGGMDQLFERLADPETRKKLSEESDADHINRWGDIYVSYVESEKNAWTVGKSITEIAAVRGVAPVDACFDLVAEERGKVNEVNYGMCEEDIEFIMSQPYTMIGSDGNAMPMDADGMPHPRNYGTFPRVLAHYCRERKLFPLEAAIQKMTGMTASRLGLQDRGLIREGMWADLVLFDFAVIEDTPDYQHPAAACKGIERVYVNGVLTALNGNHTGAKAGKVLRKTI